MHSLLSVRRSSHHIHNKKIRSFGFLQSVDMIEPGSVFLSDLDPKTFIWEVTSDQLVDQLLLLVVVLLAFNCFNKSADIEDFSIGYNFSLAITSL